VSHDRGRREDGPTWQAGAPAAVSKQRCRTCREHLGLKTRLRSFRVYAPGVAPIHLSAEKESLAPIEIAPITGRSIIRGAIRDGKIVVTATFRRAQAALGYGGGVRRSFALAARRLRAWDDLDHISKFPRGAARPQKFAAPIVDEGQLSRDPDSFADEFLENTPISQVIMNHGRRHRCDQRAMPISRALQAVWMACGQP
jgi:hypothetical protein